MCKTAEMPKYREVFVMDDFNYGTIVVFPRYNANKPFEETKDIIMNCIRVGLDPKDSKESPWEFHVVYRDKRNRIKRKCFDLTNYSLQIKHQGDMVIEL